MTLDAKPRSQSRPIRLISVIASSRLALVLVGLVLLLGLIGVILPQQGSVSGDDIRRWQGNHPCWVVLDGVGAFRVFHSWPFILTVLVLGVNTLSCTLLHLLPGRHRQAGQRSASGEAGFALLHLSIVGLLAGTFISAGFRMDGSVVLTEHQTFRDEAAAYARLSEGPLRGSRRSGVAMTLREVKVESAGTSYPVQIHSSLELSGGQGGNATGVVSVNRPCEYSGLTFIQDATGFSPQVTVNWGGRRGGGLKAFVALQTFRDKSGVEYRDFLVLPQPGVRAMITFYPDHEFEGDRAVKTGDEPVNPMIAVEITDPDGTVLDRGYVALGGTEEIGKYTFGLTGYRRWSSFRITSDPGYLVVCFSLWLGLIGIMLRYSADIWVWLVCGTRED